MTSVNERNAPDAWAAFTSRHGAGDVLRGRVTTIVHFGSFVEVAPGVAGLLHVSEYRGTPALDDELDVRIHDIDVEKRRLSLVPT